MGCRDRTIFVADAQRAGRGRHGRRWLAPAGSSILCSLVIRSGLPPAVITGSAAVAVVDIIGEALNLDARIKWPNDVMLADKKVCGILVERVTGAWIVGIGLNVNLDPAAVGLPPAATSLSAAAGGPVSREPLFTGLLQRFDRLLSGAEQDAGHELLQRWESLLWRRQQQIRLAGNGPLCTGVVEGLSPSGCLRLRRADGSLVEIVAGDLELPE